MYKFHKDHTEPTSSEAIFVFGSNLAARHGGGAALLAAKKYGASPDVSEGASGMSYAIPTKDKKIKTLSLEAIKISVQKFIKHVQENPNVEFFMTRIGCVLAGYENSDIAPIFEGAPENINFPEEWKEFIGEEQIITTYKGFDENLKCRDFQYEIGGTVEHQGQVRACGGGFHACEYPLDVFNYYPPNKSRFAIVQQSGDLSREAGGDTKLASRKLTVKAEIGIPGIIKAAIEYTFKRALPIDQKSPAFSDSERGAASATGTRGAASATGESGAASATGESGAASATGTRGAASATGTRGAASATGESGAASATGESGAASATGTRGAASATGTRGAASATGESGAASATGYSGAASATGTRGAASATGYSGAASATGTRGAASATGESGAASATGTRGAASATGYSGAASATGESGAASATGEKSVAMSSGRFGKARAEIGCAIFLVYRNSDWNIVHARSAIVGKDGIEPNVWYSLNSDGEFVKSDE